jgi:hypothetical protein
VLADIAIAIFQLQFSEKLEFRILLAVIATFL